MPISSPSRYTPLSVTSACSTSPPRRRTGKPPDHGRPSRRAAMISAAACWETSGTVTSEMSRPTASAAGQPYSCSAAPFQNSTVPCVSVAITACPRACSSSSAEGRAGSASVPMDPACAACFAWSRGERPGMHATVRPCESPARCTFTHQTRYVSAGRGFGCRARSWLTDPDVPVPPLPEGGGVWGGVMVGEVRSDDQVARLGRSEWCRGGRVGSGGRAVRSTRTPRARSSGSARRCGS